MPVNDALGTRMKTFYEEIPKTKLMRRTPVAIRIDGRAFHTFTRGFKRPFDSILQKSMHETMLYLCKNIQGCVFGYTQSDEITLILVDYKTFESGAWFDYEVQKLCSISASMATMAFNKFFTDNIHLMMCHFHYGEDVNEQIVKEEYGLTDEDLASGSDFWENRWTLYQQKMGTAQFDARCFNVPREEVTNLLYWRQIDATRNAVQMIGQKYFSHKQLHEKNCNMIIQMLKDEKGIIVEDYPAHCLRGVCAIRNEAGSWEIDYNIPLFKGEGRQYVERFIQQEEM